MRLLGLDHADIRVPSIAAVEAFYDAVLPPLGLTTKSESHVAPDGEWHDVDATRPRNAIEYGTPASADSIGWFVGFIEDDGMVPTATRIAFALDSEKDLAAVETIVREAGARVVEWSIDAGYPALFFQDPIGTRLEICARRRRTLAAK
jgi:catechol 2,3-dioxygenase-like lactoylglutathione lyase family enzyme